MKIAAIHQPNFMPWIGYFYKIFRADTFVILDNVQYSKNSFINRNKIKTPSGPIWLTVPVIKSGNFGQLISEVKIQYPDRAFKKIINTLKMNYSKTKYFRDYFDELGYIFNPEIELLIDLNVKLIEWTLSKLLIKKEIARASYLRNIEGNSTERLVSICKAVNADCYLSGFGGANYQEKELFEANQIELLTSDFNHPIYPQVWNGFLSNLSIIDLLFNCGPDSLVFFQNSDRINEKREK